MVSTESRHLAVQVASGDALDVRQFSVEEGICSLFTVKLIVLSEHPTLDFDAIVGFPARFSFRTALIERTWSGIAIQLEQGGVEERGLSTYELTIAPSLWLATQRRNFRMFQQISEPDIVLKLLAEWDIEPVVRMDRAAYKKRKYRVQYGESDYAFICRMLEDAGISFFFTEVGGNTRLVLSDAPQRNELRGGKLPFVESPNPGIAPGDYVTAVRISQRVRPGKYTMRDNDYRLAPSYALVAGAAKGKSIEQKLERYHYTPGAFLFGTDRGEPTPVADDKGRTRTDEAEAALLAQKRLDAKRGSANRCTLLTNAHDLSPGMVLQFAHHPHPSLAEDKPWLVLASKLEGTSYGEWTHRCEAQSASVPYRPPLVTPKPKVSGVESATVVGPPGEEIHTDEFGRVRVHFHWDRESRMDDNSSCWIHVSQPWGGAGYGAVNLPRVGQEVLVDFLGGDPDRPIIVGRVYTNLQKVPYGLPANKTQSGWKSNSTGGTGGYNEIMFEDAAGSELLRIQAERDLSKLVKHDETVTIGKDRTKTVGHDESVTIGHDRTKLVKANESATIGQNLTKTVKMNEREVTGGSRTISVGINRATQVGAIDSTVVGEMHSVTVLPPGESIPDATSWTMQHNRIELSTPGGASIVLEGNKITMSCTSPGGASMVLEGDQITIDCAMFKVLTKLFDAYAHDKATLNCYKETEVVSAAGTVLVRGNTGATLETKSGDVIIYGPMVKINS
jgi:type VI secretion system secreted protein VgrG